MKPHVQALRAAVDRTQFDPTDLNFALGFEAEALARFVREEIFFEPYPGILRGAQGTLLGGAGNALDQSLLLTTLLEEAGYEWRIARATLNTAQATTLVNQLVAPRPTVRPAGEMEQLRASMDQILMLQGLTDDQRSTLEALETTPVQGNPYLQATEADTRFILDALNQAGIRLGDDGAVARLIEESRDYFWVEYRIDGYDEWISAHPAFATQPAPEVSALETFTEPSADLYHRLRFEVYIEQKIDDTLIVNPIVTGYERTTASMVGRPILYQHQPNNLDYTDFTSMADTLAETGVFLPILDGKVAGNTFDLDGRIFSFALLALDRFGVTELFQSEARQLEQALGLIDALGDPLPSPEQADDFITLTSQWIEITQISPGGKEVTHVRRAFDRIGAENRAAGRAVVTDPTPLAELAKSLLTTTTIVVLPNRYNAAYYLDRYAERVLQEIALVEHAASDPESFTVPVDLINQLTAAEDLILNSAFEEGHALNEDVISYRPAAAVALYQQGLVPGRAEETLFERVDMLAAPRRTLVVQGAGVALAPDKAIREGVWETIAERAPLRFQQGVEFNTMVALRQAQARGIPLQVLSPDDIERVASLSHTTETKNNLTAALTAGYVVVVPAASVSDGQRTGWWRIDPLSGETLGVTTGDHGNASVEYLLLLFSVVNGGLSAAGCISEGSLPACCFAMAFNVFFITITSLLVLQVIAFLALSELAATAVGIVGGVGADTFGLAIPNFCTVPPG